MVTVKGAAANTQQLATIRGALAEAHVVLHAGFRTCQACIMTMTQESACLPLDYGDLDSLGPYQQRTPWGTVAQRESPAASTYLFLTGGVGGEPGWDHYYSIATGPPDGLSLDEACQQVQESAYPWAYGQWQNEAFNTVTWWMSTLTPPKSMHYERYRKEWREPIRRYDALRELVHEGKLTKEEKQWYEHRKSQMHGYVDSLWDEAIKAGRPGHPKWEAHHGWEFRWLRVRASGRRAEPTE